MKKFSYLTAVLPVFVLAAIATPTTPANATIHEIVATYCTGGVGGNSAIDGDADGHLRPPPIDDNSRSTFAKPVLANGAVVIGAGGPEIGSSPSAKFPEGTSVFALGEPDHPSAACLDRLP